MRSARKLSFIYAPMSSRQADSLHVDSGVEEVGGCLYVELHVISITVTGNPMSDDEVAQGEQIV